MGQVMSYRHKVTFHSTGIKHIYGAFPHDFSIEENAARRKWKYDDPKCLAGVSNSFVQSTNTHTEHDHATPATFFQIGCCFTKISDTENLL